MTPTLIVAHLFVLDFLSPIRIGRKGKQTMYKGSCVNCGADEGLHQYETNKCPLNGVEAPIGRNQVWMNTTFLAEEDKPLTRVEVQAMIDEALKKHNESIGHIIGY